ncbi:MAG: ribosome-associated translation inhibitor RaiA [Clostridiales bacterium]|nr:ribosome-associated translation inhibitor RaiA [Clostridiales bacterium]
MNIQLTSKKIPISPSFKEVAEKKISAKLSRFFSDEADVKILLSTRRDIVTVEVTVRHNNLIFRSEQSAEDKVDALNACIDRIIRQIRKNKTKVEKSLKESAFKESYSDYVEEQSDFNIVRTKKVALRPMSIDEAVLQMNLLGHSFFMFKNAETGLVNVVYCRDDGNYAVLEPLDV